MAEVKFSPAALRAYAGLEKAGCEPLLDAIDDAVDALEADPSSAPCHRRSFAGGLWGMPVRDRSDDWLIVWEHDQAEEPPKRPQARPSARRFAASRPTAWPARWLHRREVRHSLEPGCGDKRPSTVQVFAWRPDAHRDGRTWPARCPPRASARPRGKVNVARLRTRRGAFRPSAHQVAALDSGAFDHAGTRLRDQRGHTPHLMVSR